MKLIKVIKTITQHPLNRTSKLKAIQRFIYWQIGSRFIKSPVIFSFAERSKLILRKGLEGATGNLYCGLHEFEDMAFVLHFLRPGDLFIDIGANIGSYTILAGSEVGASTISFEPVPKTFDILQQNIRLNDLSSRAKLYNVGLGSEKGTLRFTKSLDVINHVATEGEKDTIDVPIEVLDNVVTELPGPTVVKIDVEGYETKVLEGMTLMMNDPKLMAIIIELNGSGKRYGFDDLKIHDHLLSLGFKACQYMPFERRINEVNKKGTHNTIYIKDMVFATSRIVDAKKVKILQHNI